MATKGPTQNSKLRKDLQETYKSLLAIEKLLKPTQVAKLMAKYLDKTKSEFLKEHIEKVIDLLPGIQTEYSALLKKFGFDTRSDIECRSPRAQTDHDLIASIAKIFNIVTGTLHVTEFYLRGLLQRYPNLEDEGFLKELDGLFQASKESAMPTKLAIRILSNALPSLEKNLAHISTLPKKAISIETSGLGSPHSQGGTPMSIPSLTNRTAAGAAPDDEDPFAGFTPTPSAAASGSARKYSFPAPSPTSTSMPSGSTADLAATLSGLSLTSSEPPSTRAMSSDSETETQTPSSGRGPSITHALTLVTLTAAAAVATQQSNVADGVTARSPRLAGVKTDTTTS